MWRSASSLPIAAAGVQHQPDLAGLVGRELDEVVAATERAHLLLRLALAVLDVVVQLTEAAPEAVPAREPAVVELEPVHVGRRLVGGEADRDRLLYGEAQRAQVVRQVGRGQAGAHRLHAAADVDADRGRRDSVAHRDDRADGRAVAQVDVGHDADALDPGQARDVAQLVERGLLDVLDPSPHQGLGLRAGQAHGKCVGLHGVHRGLPPSGMGEVPAAGVEPATSAFVVRRSLSS